jgi:hypothetical protein
MTLDGAQLEVMPLLLLLLDELVLVLVLVEELPLVEALPLLEELVVLDPPPLLEELVVLDPPPLLEELEPVLDPDVLAPELAAPVPPFCDEQARSRVETDAKSRRRRRLRDMARLLVGRNEPTILRPPGVGLLG